MTRDHVYTSQRYGVERVYNVSRLWSLTADFERKSIEIDSLSLNKRVWFNGVCPTIPEIACEFEKVLVADLSFPIILDQSGSIMDGYHRIVKAKIQSDRHILAVQFAINPEPDQIRWISSATPNDDLLSKLVVDLILMLHREHDRVRLALKDTFGEANALEWSADMLKLTVKTTDQLKSVPQCLSKVGAELCEAANIAMLDLLQLEIEWQESRLFMVSQDQHASLALLNAFLCATEEMRLHLSHFANGAVQ